MSPWKLFLLMMTLTLLSFGGGSSIEAGLERELVQTGVITPHEFAAGVTLGKSTPGPMAAFATAIGKYAAGVPGALLATLALIVVSLITVMVMRRVPAAWFKLKPVEAGLKAVNPIMVSFVLFLAYRISVGGSHTVLAAPIGIAGMVLIGRMFKAPTVALMLGGVAIGMLVQGTPLAGW